MENKIYLKDLNTVAFDVDGNLNIHQDGCVYRLTEKGRKIMNENKGKIIIQSLPSSGDYDYSDCKSLESALEQLKKEVPFEDAKEIANINGNFDYSKQDWIDELSSTLEEYSLNEIVKDKDPYGFAQKFGYIEEI